MIKQYFRMARRRVDSSIYFITTERAPTQALVSIARIYLHSLMLVPSMVHLVLSPCRVENSISTTDMITYLQLIHQDPQVQNLSVLINMYLFCLQLFYNLISLLARQFLIAISISIIYQTILARKQTLRQWLRAITCQTKLISTSSNSLEHLLFSKLQ